MRNFFKALRSTAAIAAVAGSVAFAAAPAQATENYLFAFTNNFGAAPQLVLNGTDTIDATSRGWYRNDGNTTYPGNQNYIVGTCEGTCAGPVGQTFRDFFQFDLSEVSGPITSATLNIYNPNNGFAGAPADFVLHDVNAFATQILSGISDVNTYNALDSGNILGSQLVNSGVNNTTISITLNSFALAALQALEGGSFVFGGTLDAASAVPLPAGAPMLLLALMGIAAAVQIRKQRATA